MAKLKVYRTPIGFHDAYVAAPSKAAALKAWGTDRDLFARAAAEMVTDAELTAEPLAKPGVVIRKLRGSAEEQLAAAAGTVAARPGPRKAASNRQPRPRPDRTALDRAEAALAERETARTEELDGVAGKIAVLERQRRAVQDKYDAALAKLRRVRDAAAAAHDAAMKAWRS